VKTIPDRFSGLTGYLAAFRFPLLEEMRAEMSANLVDSLSSGSHFPVAKIRALPVRRDRSGVQTSPSRYRLTVARGRRGARNFPCTGDVVLLSDATSPCRRPADLTRNGRSCCLAHVKYVSDGALAFEMVASERIDQAERCYALGVSFCSLIPYSRIWRCLDYATAIERNPALVRVVAGDADTHHKVKFPSHLPGVEQLLPNDHVVPRAVILEENHNKMFALIDKLQGFSRLLGRMIAGNEIGAGNRNQIQNLWRYKEVILFLTRALDAGLKLPLTRSHAQIKEFCLGSASLIFCTVSGWAKLEGQRMDLLLIDEAAQLKECESLIPLQLQGLKHAVLIGDECQLPATVISKVAGSALLGRSLFERHCLWVLGNAATLGGSGSVWMELVRDAERRWCFFDWSNGEGVSSAVTLPPPSAPVVGCEEDNRAV
ncbi:hypothetical protein BAE44_0006191, partial [Dichanthelium oligosanthes]